MKFQVASFLVFLSSVSFFHSSAWSMDDRLEDVAFPHAPLKPSAEDTIAEIEALPVDALISQYRSLRRSGNNAPASELVDFLVSTKHSEIWSKFSIAVQEKVVAGISSKAQRLDLEKLVGELDIVNKYRAVRPRNEASDEELVMYLLGLQSTWGDIISENRAWVISQVTSKAERINLEEAIEEKNLSTVFYSLRCKGNEASNEELIQYLLEQNGYKWAKLSPLSRTWVIDKIRSEAARKDLEERLSRMDYSGRFLAIRNSGNPCSDFGIVQFLLEENGYKDWHKLNYHDRQWITAQVRPRAKKINFKGADPSLNLFPVDSNAARAARLRLGYVNYAEIFEINQSAIERGYKTHLGKVFNPSFFELSRLSKNACKRKHEDLKSPTYTMKYQTIFRVTDEDSFVAAQALVEAGLNPSVSNAANAVLRGGGVKEGAQAQEEEICKRSTLYNGLLPELYPMADNELIYTPSITVFMNPGDYAFMDEPFTVSVITQAYPCLSPTLVEPEKQPWYQTITESKVRAHLRLAAEMGHDSLILAASGCGVFAGGRSGPVSEAVAQIYARLFASEFKGVFKEVRFAILRGGVINRAFERYINPLNEIN